MSESKDVTNYMEESKESNQMIVRPSVGLAGLGAVDDMREKLKQHDEKRNVILEYIEDNLVEGVDFGCTDDRSPDKSTLMKPGAEKVCRLFDTHPHWMADYDTWTMAGKPPGTIFLICQIINNKTGEVIGEGRGAEKIGNKGRDANKAIKNAEKCAVVDAALYTFMLSEKFTQDGGGKKQAVLIELKRELIADIGTTRTGIPSEITDHMWVQIVLKQIIHKARIDTIGEYNAVRKMIFEEKAFDFTTGLKR